MACSHKSIEFVGELAFCVHCHQYLPTKTVEFKRAKKVENKPQPRVYSSKSPSKPVENFTRIETKSPVSSNRNSNSVNSDQEKTVKSEKNETPHKTWVVGIVVLCLLPFVAPVDVQLSPLAIRSFILGMIELTGFSILAFMTLFGFVHFIAGAKSGSGMTSGSNPTIESPNPDPWGYIAEAKAQDQAMARERQRESF
jgi:hypothetical protein